MLAVFFFTLFYVKSTIITVESSKLQFKSQITLIYICIHMRVKERYSNFNKVLAKLYCDQEL